MRDRPVERPDLLDARATITLVIAALVISVRRFQGFELDVLLLAYEAWPREPWRLFTSCLLHGGWLHLAFNLYWILRFGSILEPVFGALTRAILFLFLGTSSMAAEWAFARGGIGLSGIAYTEPHHFYPLPPLRREWVEMVRLRIRQLERARSEPDTPVAAEGLFSSFR